MSKRIVENNLGRKGLVPIESINGYRGIGLTRVTRSHARPGQRTGRIPIIYHKIP